MYGNSGGSTTWLGVEVEESGGWGLVERWRNSQMVCHRPEGGVHPVERVARSGLRLVGLLGGNMALPGSRKHEH